VKALFGIAMQIAILLYGCATVTQSERTYNVSGTWKGILLQPTNSDRSPYNYWMMLRQDGDRLIGTTRIETGNDFGVMTLTGQIVDGDFVFEEGRVTSQRITGMHRWYIKSGRLKIDGNKLSGEWRAEGDGGTIHLTRSASDS
jgi:hypothetical protein